MVMAISPPSSPSHRLEGKPSQTVTGPNDGPIKVELRTSEDVRIFLLERGIDAESIGLPRPLMQIEAKKGCA